jgi:hypothetical protein
VTVSRVEGVTAAVGPRYILPGCAPLAVPAVPSGALFAVSTRAPFVVLGWVPFIGRCSVVAGRCVLIPAERLLVFTHGRDAGWAGFPAGAGRLGCGGVFLFWPPQVSAGITNKSRNGTPFPNTFWVLLCKIDFARSRQYQKRGG